MAIGIGEWRLSYDRPRIVDGKRARARRAKILQACLRCPEETQGGAAAVRKVIAGDLIRGVDGHGGGSADAGDVGGEIFGAPGWGPEKCMLGNRSCVGEPDNRTGLIDSGGGTQRAAQ